ncbi:MAG: hypothetical protein M3N07_10110, partial [Pseudomonadota bacterium]|nr:hypothetical protein [Pseudomonadota bacterium]
MRIFGFLCCSMLLSGAAVAGAPAEEAPGSTERPGFQRLFVDWRTASRQSLEAERQAAPAPHASAPGAAAGTVAG